MALTVFLRAPILRQRFATRGFHITRPARSAHGDYHHFPFAFPGSHGPSKAGFGFKVFVYLLTGFTIPFVAASHQLRKAGA